MLSRILNSHTPEYEPATAAARTQSNSTHLIELHRVVKTYKSDAGIFIALDGIDLQVDAGAFVAVVGKSGSGKSTLINLLAGISRPTSGQIHIGDTAVHTLNEGEKAAWRGTHIGLVFQFFQLLPTLSLLDNVRLPMVFAGKYAPAERLERAMHLLDTVGVADFAYMLPGTVSGGQQQRAAIARALANDPPLLLCDEPTGNLDSATATHIFDLFCSLIEDGKTVLMVTHDHELADQTPQVIEIHDGCIVRHQKNGATAQDVETHTP